MRPLEELTDIEELVGASRGLLRCEVLAHVRVPGGARLPVYGLALGSPDRRHPTFGLFGGVHGLERVGTRVVLAWLQSLVELVSWDAHEARRLETCRVVAIPLVNPGGMAMGLRANPRGVDLMRNAPVDAEDRATPILGGHRLTPLLPWYRGAAGAAMEVEARALADFVTREMFEAEAALALDVHSGFGVRDRLWFPYAKTRGAFPRAAEARRLRARLDRIYPHHVYLVEPQSASYLTHGDLWDHLFDAHLARHGPDGPPFVPWTLEMGSWSWVRKNPRQLLSVWGPFNPVVPHRLSRALRRHLALAGFMLHAVHNHATWAGSAIPRQG